jgi:hypothetical protein
MPFGAAQYRWGGRLRVRRISRSEHQIYPPSLREILSRRSCEHPETTIRRVKGVRLAEFDISSFLASMG